MVTTGNFWQFLQLETNVIGLDGQEYHIKEIAKILGILAMMLAPRPHLGSTEKGG